MRDYHFLAGMFLTQPAIKPPFKFPPHLMSAAALSAKKTEQVEYALK